MINKLANNTKRFKLNKMLKGFNQMIIIIRFMIKFNKISGRV